jgi:hypothetical protein
MRIYSVRRESAAKPFALTRRAPRRTEGSSGAPPSQDGEGGVVGFDTELDPDRDIPVKVLLNQTRDVFDADWSGTATLTEYVLNVSLTFDYRRDAEQAETHLATTVFNGLVSRWSEVEEVTW